MKNILIPVDFSNESKNALQLGISLAKQFDGTLHVLHVVDGVTEGSFNVEGEATANSSWEDRIFNMKLIEIAKKNLAKLVADLSDSGVKFKTSLRFGDAFHGINEMIIKQKADLVIMGTKGSSGYKEVLVGSNTEKVVRRSGSPVIAVNKKVVSSFKNIVWATSLREEDLVMPAVLKSLIAKYNPQIHLVRVNTPGLFLSDGAAKEKLQEFASIMKLKNCTLNVYSDYTEEEGIIRFADSIDADMIALSTHGRTGISHLFSGSIAEDVVNHAKRPVLTFKTGK
ncbi:MAG TPA: universal stress protein [Cyclobacteriaceae bacterium]|nr:universal stress protein [Cyclobacteriaceae bacterium]